MVVLVILTPLRFSVVSLERVIHFPVLMNLDCIILTICTIIDVLIPFGKIKFYKQTSHFLQNVTEISLNEHEISKVLCSSKNLSKSNINCHTSISRIFKSFSIHIFVIAGLIRSFRELEGQVDFLTISMEYVAAILPLFLREMEIQFILQEQSLVVMAAFAVK